MSKRKMGELIWRKIFSGGGGGQGEARKKSRLDMLWNRWKKEETAKGKSSFKQKQADREWKKREIDREMKRRGEERSKLKNKAAKGKIKKAPKKAPKKAQKLLPASKEAERKQSAAVRERIKRANEAEKNLPKGNPRAVGKFRGRKKMEVPEGVKKAGAKVKKVAKKAASKIPKTTTKQKVKIGTAGAGLYYLSEKYKQVKKKQKKSKK